MGWGNIPKFPDPTLYFAGSTTPDPELRILSSDFEGALAANNSGNALEKLYDIQVQPQRIQYLTAGRLRNHTARLRWIAPVSKNGEVVQYLLNCHPHPGPMLRIMPDSCSIREASMPKPKPPYSLEYAFLDMGDRRPVETACTCSIRSVDSTGSISLPSKEVQIKVPGFIGELTLTAISVFALFLFVLGFSVVLGAFCRWRERRVFMARQRQAWDELSRSGSEIQENPSRRRRIQEWGGGLFGSQNNSLRQASVSSTNFGPRYGGVVSTRSGRVMRGGSEVFIESADGNRIALGRGHAGGSNETPPAAASNPTGSAIPSRDPSSIPAPEDDNKELADQQAAQKSETKPVTVGRNDEKERVRHHSEEAATEADGVTIQMDSINDEVVAGFSTNDQAAQQSSGANSATNAALVITDSGCAGCNSEHHC